MIDTAVLEPVPVGVTPQLVSPREACLAWHSGADVVDLRSPNERLLDGPLDGAVDLGQRRGGLMILVCRDGHRSAELASTLAGDSGRVMIVAGGYAGWRRAVWRDWGEFLMAEPDADIGRFFRLLR